MVRCKWLLMLAMFASAVAAQVVEPVAPILPAKTAGEQGTRLILLGSGGGPIIGKFRSQPATLLVVNGRPYLIDCGEGTVRQLKTAGFEAYDIARVFLTHLHLDHTVGVAALVGLNWASGSTRQPVEIFGPPGTEALVKKGIDYISVSADIHSAQYPPHPKLAQIIHPHDVDVTGKRLVYKDDRLQVFAIENSHYLSLRMGEQSYGKVKSYSYRFETPDRTIVFSGDTGPSDALVELAKGADILVSEVINVDGVVGFVKAKFKATDKQLQPLIAHMHEEHLVPAEIGKLAAKAGVKVVVLSHVASDPEEVSKSIDYVGDVTKSFSGPVILGKDFDQF